MTAGGGVAAAERTRLVKAEIDADDDVRRKADEPGIPRFIGGAGFAGNRLADFLHRDRRSALHHAFHHRGDLIGGHGIEHLLAAIDQLRLRLILPAAGRVAATAFTRIVLEYRVPVTVLDTIDQGRLHATAAIGKHRIGRDHPHHRGLAGAQRIGQIIRQFVINSETPGIFADQGHADVLRQPHRDGVERQSQRVAQCHRPLVFARRKILRAPDAGALPLIDFDRRVDHHRRGRVAIIECRRIHDRLERRTRLPIGLGRAVELALVEREPADHRQHAAGPGVHHHHRAGHFRQLAQPVLTFDRIAVLSEQRIRIDHIARRKHLRHRRWRPALRWP